MLSLAIAIAAQAAGNGPNVICSEIGSALSGFGVVGDVGAYSMTTVSCNIGTADASWIDSGPQPNRHPVIGMQFHRLEIVGGAARFEQIGMSWLKHGFCAADAPGCTSLGPPGSTYVPNPSCDWLGLFATDTYSAAFNASQLNYGPRSEVDPWTGAYPYPYLLGAGQTGDAIYKRLQIRQSDLDPALHPGARYFAEVVYVCTDEPDAHKLDNYSVRESLVGPIVNGQRVLSFTGSTFPMESALEHWAAIDAGVVLAHADVPGDGRLWLAHSVTDVGGGMHHYEYVLFNMNCARGARSISVPLGLGAGTANVGFHDADYHSGEPYSPANWAVSIAPGASVTWASEDHASNVNANALRWSTAYAFRFDSNAPPIPGDVTVELFVPGSPASITFAGVSVPGALCDVLAYCTSSTTTNGCSPVLSGLGAPSASASSGFTVACGGAEGQRTGLLFFGTAPVAVPWSPNSTSTRCVDSPVQRTASANSGGTSGACDGSYGLDWNAWRAAHPAGLGSPYTAGQVFFVQMWMRDPPAPTGTNLSDALSFSLCP